jgi:hypothetical protein
MCSNSSDIVVVNVADYGSSSGGSAQMWPDQCCGSVIGATAGLGGGSQISKAAMWIWRRGDRLMRERHPSTTRRRRSIGDGGSGAVWEASAGGDVTESFDLLIA